MNSYSSYKDSGVEWIGKIPSNWDMKRIDHFFTERKDKVDYITYPPLSVTMNGIKDQLEGVAKSDDSSNRKLVLRNDFVINSRSDRKGSSGISFRDGSVSLINTVLEPKNIKPKYVNYLLKSYYFIEEFFRFGKGIHFDLWSTSYSLMKNIKIPVLSIEEQQQISDYLDYKTSNIDILIDKTQQKIELLKEQRISLINTTVTKGLNSNVEMKDSGVEWIGEIPSGWGFNKVGNNTYVKGRIGWKGLRSEDFIEKGPYLITGTDFKKDGTIEWENMYHVSQERYDEDPFIQLQDHDVLITKDGTIGKVLYVGNLKGQTCLNSGIFLTRPTKDEYISKYFYWILLSNVFKVFVNYNSGGSTIQHLYQNVFVNFKFPIPPHREQQQISDYLDYKTSKIDKLIDIESKRIDLLKEYRQSLISDVVTGKVDIRDEVLV